jgi:general secretion pathway protein M
MMRHLSKPVRQIAAVALLVLSLSLLALVTVVPLTAHIASLQDQIDAHRGLLGRFAQIAAREGEATEHDRTAKAALDSGAYLKGESDALVAAGLQAILAEIASTHRVRLHSTRALPARDRDQARFIGVRLQFNAQIDQVRSLLHHIEASKPFLLIEALQIQPISPYAQRDLKQAGALEVRVDVFGAVAGKRG